MAFCTNCGAQVSDGKKFCPSCGQKIGGSEPATHAAPVQATPVQPVQNEEPKQAEAPVQGTYQATYTPPTQQSYTPPTQQSYQAPAQQGSYQPQQGNPQQSYSAQPAYAPAAQTTKQKKPINKKLLFIIGGAVLAVILAIVLISALGGKGNKAADYLECTLRSPQRRTERR